VARVVVDLLAPRVYNWDAAGNRIVVHLGKNPVTNSSPFQAPTVVSLTSPLQRPLVTGVRSRGPLSLASDEGSVGSAFSAGADTAILRLSSGGEVHVCPGTTVAITPSQTRHNLMLSMNTGALEAHFSLDASSDSVMTPDFRILLVGPGEFHYAFSADPQGNTCVRALPGNTASAIVSELIGDRTYQVKATDQLLFRSGQLDRVDLAVPLECGCPPAREPQLRAENIPPKEIENIAQRPTSTATPANDSRRAASAAAPQPAGVSANPNEGDPKEIHVQIEAPFVFHAKGPAPAPVADVAALPLESRPAPAAPSAPLPPPSADPAAKTAADQPASANPPPQHGFFKKLGGFFSSLFH
jgi:hypothetical protein